MSLPSDPAHRRRYRLILGLTWAGICLALMAIMVAVVNRVIPREFLGVAIATYLFIFPVIGYFGLAEKRRQRVCDAVIHSAERQYLLLARISDQSATGTADASEDAKTRWFGEINRFIDRYSACVSKPGDINIINEYRADLILAIDRLVVQDIDA